MATAHSCSSFHFSTLVHVQSYFGDYKAPTLVRVLASALATCYWAAKIDVNDCEFVLGLSRAASNENAVGRYEKPLFNLVCDNGAMKPITMDEEGVQEAVHAVWRNDPNFPLSWTRNYTEKDGRLWEVFTKAFLEESEKMREQRHVNRLARLGVEGVEEGRRRNNAAGIINDVSEQ